MYDEITFLQNLDYNNNNIKGSRELSSVDRDIA